MNKIEFQAEHGVAIQAHVIQEAAHLELTAEKWARYKEGPAFTGENGSGPMICAGVLPVWDGRWYAWAAISEKVRRKEMLWIHRNVHSFLENLQSYEPRKYRRVETTARSDQPNAQRWLELLGFQREGRLRCYDASGLDHIQYARFPCHLTPVQSAQ